MLACGARPDDIDQNKRLVSATRSSARVSMSLPVRGWLDRPWKRRGCVTAHLPPGRRVCSLVAHARAGCARGLTGQETSKMENTDSCSMGDSIGAADSVELFQQRCDVILGRVRRNAEPPRDLLV